MDARTTDRLAALAAGVLALAIVAGCSASTSSGGAGGGSSGSAPSDVKLTEAQNATTVEVAKGGTVTVSLTGNPTTGFDWIPDGLVPPVLAQQGQSSFKPQSSLIGAAGVVTLTFKAVESGRGELKLQYKRPFETTSTPARTWSANVVVK